MIDQPTARRLMVLALSSGREIGGSRMSQWDSDSSERLLFGMTQLLRSAGDARAVSVLLNAAVDVEWDRYDNWNGGLYYVTVILQVDYLTFGQLDAEEKGRLTATLAEVAQPILPLSENDTFQGVRISPTGSPSAGWREEAAAWISTLSPSPGLTP